MKLKEVIVSVRSSHPQETIDQITLANLLTPMQFKTVLMVAYGLRDFEVAQILGTTEPVIRNALRDAYCRTGCWNSGELVRRYFREVADGLLDLGRLRRELAEVEARAAQYLHVLPFRHIN
jgi:DNA-binding CsgD family transcriptional regulator